MHPGKETRLTPTEGRSGPAKVSKNLFFASGQAAAVRQRLNFSSHIGALDPTLSLRPTCRYPTWLRRISPGSLQLFLNIRKSSPSGKVHWVLQQRRRRTKSVVRISPGEDEDINSCRIEKSRSRIGDSARTNMYNTTTLSKDPTTDIRRSVSGPKDPGILGMYPVNMVFGTCLSLSQSLLFAMFIRD